MYTDEPVVLRLEVDGEKSVTAADIIASSDVVILNRVKHIATVGQGASLRMEIVAEKSRGYVPADKN